MATTATTTGRSTAAPDDAFELLRRLVPLLPAWSYEGTLGFWVAWAGWIVFAVAAALVRVRA